MPNPPTPPIAIDGHLRRLGWTPSRPDPRNFDYRMSLVTPRADANSSRLWQQGPVMDQGPGGQCVGYAWRAWMDSDPEMDPPDFPPSAVEIHKQSQLRTGAPYDINTGTTVHAAAEYMQSQGRIQNYLWGMSAEEVRDFILTTGPVVFGTYWYPSMGRCVAPDYVMEVVPEPATGGHTYLLCGWDGARQMFRVHNSWATSWGDGGYGWIRFSHMRDTLMNSRAGGSWEACAAAELPGPPKPQPVPAPIPVPAPPPITPSPPADPFAALIAKFFADMNDFFKRLFGPK